MKITFPSECEEYINLQCNGDRSLYEDFPEHKHIDEYLKDLSPKMILDIGAGIGRVSVWLHNKYRWFNAFFILMDGDSGNKQYDGVRKKEGEYYNNWGMAYSYCHNNGMGLVKCVLPEECGSSKKKYDLIYSFLAIGFHWGLDMYLNRVYPLCHKDTLLIFGLRGTEKKAWIQGQIDRIDPKKYKILKFVHKPTQTRESVLVLCPVNL